MIATVIVWSACVRDAQAGERKFIVMLANSPKQFSATGGLPPGGLVDRATIDNAYFEKVAGDSLDSFAEYWEEISYGDVTIAGLTTDWISLPWAIQPQASLPADFVSFGSTLFTYGKSERFNSSTAMIIIDTDGDPRGGDNGPFIPGPGGRDKGRNAGSPVWMPGQRFLDIDDDSRWDGLDEINNVMDHDDDSIPDNLGPWVDLDDNGQPNNEVGCVFLPDSDNDGNLDCCPDGPGLLSCGGIIERDNPSGNTTIVACPPTTQSVTIGNQQVTVNDCNGNGIPDPCDVPSIENPGGVCIESPECVATGWLDDPSNPCGSVVDPILGTRSLLSPDVLPFNGTPCAPNPNGVPDECEFVTDSWITALTSGNECTDETPPTDGSITACSSRSQCAGRTLTSATRCEFDDSNGDSAPDVVEPFESFISLGTGVKLDIDTTFGREYITNNYPGDAAKVINQSISRTIWGKHDPSGNASSCVCNNGMPCLSLGTCSASSFLCETSADCPSGQSCNMSIQETGMCAAGEHLSYTSPDSWTDSGTTTKMGVGPIPVIEKTPRPSWYKQAWKDRYPSSIRGDCLPGCTPNCTPDECVPVWNPSHTVFPSDSGTPGTSDGIPGMVPIDDTRRRGFTPNRGGLFGNGRGTVGGETVLSRVLPEELNITVAVPNAPLVLFDGYVEHDDLPSSKYHQGGDQRLGEVTSPIGTEIWGQDIAPVLDGGDGAIGASGPYAVKVHGNLNTDAGNVLSMEILTWRWEPPFNDGEAWDSQAQKLYLRPGTTHPYAGLNGEALGFRDYNLDGLIDQGEVRPVGSENYLNDADPQLPRIPGTQTAYPWNRQRLIEDCVEALDSIIDFDEYRDSNALGAARCAGTVPPVIPPAQFSVSSLSPDGAVSGIVLLPNGSHGPSPDFLLAPWFYPIHDDDASNPGTKLSNKLNWNLVFHDLVQQLPPGGAANDLNVTFTAHEYLHSWERYPDLYDYEVFLPSAFGAKINTPVGAWDIMAGSGAVNVGGGLVHPSPILKASRCSQWIEPIDLTTVLTPGVDTRLTLPPSEFVRDESHFFLENEDVLGERYYFWSAGNGINMNMPGTGMLIQHTDVGGNPEALPSGQQNATRFQYLNVQADGLRQLEDGIVPFGDAGDPFPGSTNNTTFTCETNPGSKWYTFNTCIGLSVTDIKEDGNGSVSAIFNLVPTSIPSLRFIQPPGGDTDSASVYTIKVRVADSFGGTTVQLYYTNDKVDVTIGSNFIGQFTTITPGANDFDVDWNVSGLSDGQYFLFAKLIPGTGADSRKERAHTNPRNGRNNKGSGSILDSNISVSGTARFETWVVRATDAAGTDWVVNSSLSQPDVGLCAGGNDDGRVCDLNTDCDSGVCNTDRFSHATTGTPYTSDNSEVTFTINAGSIPFTIGDTITFSTTGITATSAPVTIISGIISDDPIAIIDATPLTGPSPLTVSFDGRRSNDPSANQGLEFQWDFGDGSPLVDGSSVVTHTYSGAQTFTATLTVTNKQNARTGEASVDIILANNSPNAEMSASPLDGPTPLTVSFSSVGTSDNESDTSDLVFEWDFGDGTTAGTGVPGEFTSVDHIYFDEGNFTAALSVTDPGGKRDTVTLNILVGNTRPVAVITTTQLSGTDPHTVTFDATNSTDADGDDLTVVWTFDVNNPSADNTGACNGVDDCTQDLSAIPAGTDGSVKHTYRVPSGQSSATFTTTAVLTDSKGASVKKSFSIVINEAPFGAGQPRARFTITPNPPLLDEEFTADASASFDSPDPDIDLVSYSWNWGDNTSGAGEIAKHTYSNPGRFPITLTVTDVDGNVNSSTQIVSVAAGDEEDSDNRDPVARIGTGPRSGSVPLTIEFNGLNSFDPDGDPLEFTWQFEFGDTLVDVLTGPIVTETFELAGTYTVTLLVSDGRGGLGISDPAVIIQVDPRVGAPSTDGSTPGQPTTEPTSTPRPGICGLGMVTSMFGSLIGLLGMIVSRRRFWL